MFQQFFTKNDNRELSWEVPVADYIPYACHYDDDTLLTKNGELLQVIKILGFSSENVGSKDFDLRALIRQTIRENVRSSDFALWIHTIRRKKSLVLRGDHAIHFSGELQAAWNKKNQWDSTYVNELYITVIKEGVAFKPSDAKVFLQSLHFEKLKRNHQSSLKKTSEELKTLIEGMLSVLKPYGARRLSVIKRQSGYYSQPLQFISKILNLAESQVPLPMNDVSEYLATHKVAMGFNSLEIIGLTGKHFAASFTVKEYHELDSSALDDFLQLPQEFIITQTLDFINSKEALGYYKKQKELIEVSGDSELMLLNGVNDIFINDTGSDTDFGESQFTILFINQDVDGLRRDVVNACQTLGELGIVAVRADLKLEQNFWAQLPGNFLYLDSPKPISIAMFGGMASLYNSPLGKIIGNRWGDAVTVMKTAVGTPYFFNFHVKNNGHTAIMGPFGSGKTVLMNFLVSQAQKFNGKLFYFDQNRASKVFIKAMGGQYTIIKPQEPSSHYAFNPFFLEDNDDNRTFLIHWLCCLLTAGGNKLPEDIEAVLQQALQTLFSLPLEQRRLNALLPMLDEDLGGELKIWCDGGQYAHLFDNDVSDVMNLGQMIYGFGMSHVLEDDKTLGPVLLLLLHFIEVSLDGKPAIIVLDEAWNLVNNEIFAPGLEDWLDRMQQKNAVVIFATENISNLDETKITNSVAKKIATQIFLPNFDAEQSSRAYKEIWRLTDEEFDMLASMRVEHRQFMLKQDGNAIVTTLDLQDYKELSVLSGGDEAVKAMEQAIAEKGDLIADWLSAYYDFYTVEPKKNLLDYAL